MATLFVSPGGSAGGSGSFEQPFGTIQDGVDALTPGDVLEVRAGRYAEDVKVKHLKGTATAPIVIRPFEHDTVTIDGRRPVDITGRTARFQVGGNTEWIKATELGAHKDEYVSVHTFAAEVEQDMVRYGAFLDREPYTRLVSYGRLDDLRAKNQKFGKLDLTHPLLPAGGPPVTDGEGVPLQITPVGGVPMPFKFPSVYMGPGLFFDAAGQIHIRLSHTENHVPGLEEYDGGTDPRHIRLAISYDSPAPLVVEDCTHLRVEHLTVRFGGSRTIRIAGSSDVVFDHVRVCTGQDGIRFGSANQRVTFAHCAVSGGIPPWLFRSDIKDEYRFVEDGAIVPNTLAAGTSKAMLMGSADDVDTVIHHCEFVDGHDLSLFGLRTRFHHNWIHNLHDDALIMDGSPVGDLQVFDNVITATLMAMSFAGDNPGGQISVHHNLIDLRTPTAGIRPRLTDRILTDDDPDADAPVFRFGQLYKSNQTPEHPDGPLDFFQNTCLVREQRGLTGIQHYNNSDGGPRRSLNNIFVDVHPAADRPAGYATAFLPAPTFRGPTDGNCCFQLGGEPNPLLRHRKYRVNGDTKPARNYPDLAAYTGTSAQEPSTHFLDSKTLYPPGFEDSGIDVDPAFRRIGADGAPHFDDDLRLADGSPARQHGVELADPAIGIITQPPAPAGRPDIGCYRSGQDALEVGVNGRRRFPGLPA